MGVSLYHGDCLDLLPTLEAHSIDAIITDLPYGTTACAWDEVIPFAPMWAEVKRVLKPRGAFVTTASQPFASLLIASSKHEFKHELIWDKGRGSEPQLANVRPMKSHENILVFGVGRITYNPQMELREQPIFRGKLPGHRPNSRKDGTGQNILVSPSEDRTYTHRFPVSILKCANSGQSTKDHPTQKPVALYEYLIRTYTNAGDTVLDFTMGSGTTGVAAVNTNRNFIGMEKERNYFDIATRRIEEAQIQMPLLEVA
jgi:site-specific DNA-methyltransferase (adenine-specific)